MSLFILTEIVFFSCAPLRCLYWLSSEMGFSIMFYRVKSDQDSRIKPYAERRISKLIETVKNRGSGFLRGLLPYLNLTLVKLMNLIYVEGHQRAVPYASGLGGSGIYVLNKESKAIEQLKFFFTPHRRLKTYRDLNGISQQMELRDCLRGPSRDSKQYRYSIHR